MRSALAVGATLIAALGITLGVTLAGHTPSGPLRAVTDASVAPAATAAFGTPAMDATDDPIWNNTEALDIDPAGSPISAVTRFMWDSQYLYVLVTVNDSTPYYNNPGGGTDGYDQGLYNDSVDIWINWTDSPTASYTSDTGSYFDITRGGIAGTNYPDSPGCNLSTLLSKVVTTSTQYTVEAAIPWPTNIVRPGSPIGANTSINDVATSAGQRNDYITWDTANDYWDTPDFLPTVEPVGNNDGTIFEDTSTYDVTLGEPAYLPTWPALASADDVTYTGGGSAAPLDAATGMVTGLSLGTETVTASAPGYSDDTLTIDVIIPPGPAGFILSTFTLPGTGLAGGASVSQSIAGFWRTTTPTSFTKVAGASWLSVSADGVISGTVPSPVPSQDGAIEIQGTDGTTTSTIDIVVPVASSDGGHFLTHAMTAADVQSGGAVTQSVAGLWSGPAPATFTKVSGSSWLQVSADGVVTGDLPENDVTPGVITVEGNDGTASDDVTIQVPVVPAGQRPQITAASWNLSDDGAGFTGALGKELAAITSSGLNVIGLQETDGTGAKDIADALGWYSYQSGGDLGIVSAYPITDVTAPTTATPAAGVTIDVDGENVRVWDAHLSDADYGPARAAAGDTDLAAYELTTTRYAQAQAIAKEIAPDLATAAKTPVLLLGDLASPSGLDWTAATSKEHDNAGAVDWPVPALFAKAGLTDSFRQVNPNPVTAPGNTYNLTVAAGAGERIDYVDYRGPLLVTDAESYYTGRPSATNSAAGQWPSDHAAAVTTFRLLPASAFRF